MATARPGARISEAAAADPAPTSPLIINRTHITQHMLYTPRSNRGRLAGFVYSEISRCPRWAWI